MTSIESLYILVRDQIGEKFLADGRAAAGDGVPTSHGGIPLYIHIALTKRITAAGNIAEIRCRFIRSADFVKSGINKAQWMPGHLIGHSDNPSPGPGGRAGPTNLLPLPIVVNRHSRLRGGARSYVRA